MPANTDEAFVTEYRPLVVSIANKVRARFDLKGDLDGLLFDALVEAHGEVLLDRAGEGDLFGAAPVPVPPPIPAVMKHICAPAR